MQPVVLVLIVCRNRRETTLTAIRRVRDQRNAQAAPIALLDDGSTDGTSGAITEAFPDVQIFQGDGSAFWNGGLHQLWSAVRYANVDAFLWLNDDSWLDDDAFDRFDRCWREMESKLGNRSFILVGATRGARAETTYGGFDVERSMFAFRLIPVKPDAAQLKPTTTFNGNVVLVGREVVDAIGINDPGFFHNLGDVDYGLRAQRAGVPVMLLPGTVAYCEGNLAKRQQGYGSRYLSVFGQWRKVNGHHGLPFASWWRFTRRHSGIFWPLHFLLPYRHLLRVWCLRDKSAVSGGDTA
jgi:GT2 family glycosyltransferase